MIARLQDVTIRLASLADIPTVAMLRRAWTEETAGAPVDDPSFGRQLSEWYHREAEHRLVWLSELAGEPVGMLNLLVFERMPQPGRDASRWGYLANVFTLARVRDLGIGRQLLDVVIAHARAHGFARLVLNPSARSVPFYVRAGFAPSPLLQLDLTPP